MIQLREHESRPKCSANLLNFKPEYTGYLLNYFYTSQTTNMFQELATIPPREIVDGYTARFIHTENMTLAFWEIRAGAVMPLHHHVHEQTSQVLEGRFELTIDGKPTVFGPGFVAVIPSGVPHGGIAITDCKLLDIFSPCRDDYK